MVADLRSALRLLAKNPVLALTAILSLALGIGANATIFTYANALLLGKPPVAAPHRLVEVWIYSRLPGLPFNGYLPVSYPEYQDISRQTRSLSGLAIYSPFQPANREREGVIRPLVGQVVSTNYFSVLGVNPVLGRGFTRDEGIIGARPVVVVSYSLWQRALGGKRAVLGETMRLNGHDFTIVGVAPHGFNGLFAGISSSFYVPTSQADIMGLYGSLNSRGNHSWLAVGRLRPGVAGSAAEADLDLIFRRITAQYPKDEIKDALARTTPLGLVPYVFRQPVAGVMGLLAVIVGLVLLIACANAANLLFVQAQGRQRELAIRGALGAGRWRLARQALTESVVLALLAGVAGLWIASWLAPLILKLAPPSVPVMAEVIIGWPVVLFTFAIAFLTGLITGLAPAMRGTRAGVMQALREGTPGAGQARSRLRGVLVAGEVAVCMFVLAGAGLCVRSLAQARKINPGFDAAHLLIAQQIDPQSLGYRGERAAALLHQAEQRARQLPGITSVSWINYPPLQGSESDTSIDIPGLTPPPGQDGFDVQYFQVGPRYFATMGTRLLAGRGFTPQDVAQAGRVLIVNEAFAQRFWPGQNSIGKEVDLRSQGKAAVIGVVETGKYRTLGEAPRPVFFRLQKFDTAATLVARTAGDPEALLMPLRRALTEVDPNLPGDSVLTGAQFMATPLVVSRITAVLLASFAGLALLLALVGLYGVIAYSVGQRTREFGIRIAMGAQAGSVAKLVVGQGLGLALAGVVVGLGASLLLLRGLSALLYGVSPSDPVTLAAVAVLLLALSAMASYWPARRAMRVDPWRALREE